VPRSQRIRVPAFPQVVLVLVNDERPPDYGQLSLKQRHLGRGKMKCAAANVAKISCVRAYASARSVVRIRGVEMPATAGAVAAQ